MAATAEIESRFTGFVFLLRRFLSRGPDGRLRLPPGPDFAYAPKRSRRV